MPTPAKGGVLNFARWVERLRLRRSDEPVLIHAVQPVQVVSDVSSLVSPVLPPQGLAGGSRGNVVGVFETFEFRSLAPGGSLVTVEVSHGGTIAQSVEVLAAPLVMANLVAIAIANLTPLHPVLSTPRLGTIAVGRSATTAPIVRRGPNLLIPIQAYVPYSHFLYISNLVTGEALDVYCQWIEFPAGPRE